MLKELYIENVAIIKQLSVCFGNHFMVFTGETGAGKSIIIDSINLILGNRGSKGLIRSGEQSCSVSALFRDVNQEVKNKLKDFGYHVDDEGNLLISREFFEDSRNICRINGKPCTVSILREIGMYLVTIHGQNDNRTLFDSNTQRYLIDKYGNHDRLLASYQKEFLVYQELKASFEKITVDELTRQRQIDILKFQIQELDEASLKPGEEQDLINRKKFITNHKVLSDNIFKSMQIIDGSDVAEGVKVLLLKLEKSLTKCDDIDKIKDMILTIKDMQYNISDVYHELCLLNDSVDFSEDDINKIESRLDVIYKIKRKYGSTYEDILNFYNQTKVELENAINIDFNKEKLREKLDKQRDLLKEIASQLSSKRKETALKFIDEVKLYLNQLDLPNMIIDLDFQNVEFNLYGSDRLEFLISANVGESMKPLAKIASGGEISRIMLGIKTVLADNDFIDTVIFDEIDTGVSGSTAYNIGVVLKKLALKKQVVSITHSAQVAALSDKHLLIKKIIRDGKTFVCVRELDKEERKHELARILGGAQITDNTLKSAQELLDVKI